MSILSFPERGKWGKANWRGNCSGHVYQDLFNRLQPAVFVDPMVGSGTSVEVAREMGIEAHGLDLHSGFNAISDSILLAVGKPADLCLSHPPYGAMIVYSGNVWGQANPNDLSRCSSDEDFHEKMQLVLMNQRDATRPEGYYGRMRLPFILHEYIVLWKKKATPLLVLLNGLAHQQYARLTGTWKNVVKAVLMQLGGKSDLSSIYAAVESAAPERLGSNPNWKAKVRQTLNQNATMFTPVSTGVWAIA